MSEVAAAAGAGPVLDPAKAARLRHACTQLEAVFMNELAKALRETVPQDGVLPAGTGGEMFSAMLDERLADLAATRMRSGLAGKLFSQLGGQP